METINERWPFEEKPHVSYPGRLLFQKGLLIQVPYLPWHLIRPSKDWLYGVLALLIQRLTIDVGQIAGRPTMLKQRRDIDAADSDTPGGTYPDTRTHLLHLAFAYALMVQTPERSFLGEVSVRFTNPCRSAQEIQKIPKTHRTKGLCQFTGRILTTDKCERCKRGEPHLRDERDW
jgi:hypothetical protein